MDSAIKVHPANGTKTDDQATSAADRKLLDRLVKLWRSHVERDFETRHQTGRLLNERLNPPTERQPQGQRVLKTAAKELGVAESDLSRMRWLAHLFADVAALRQAHPEITNWTRFKEALPSLVPVKGGEARKTTVSPSRPALRGVVRSCTNLASMLDGLDFQPGDAEREKLVDGLRELAEAAYRRLKIRVEVAVE
jgi:hypothetical protein